MICSHCNHFSISTSTFHGGMRSSSNNFFYIPTSLRLTTVRIPHSINSDDTTTTPVSTEQTLDQDPSVFPRKQNSRSTALLMYLQSDDEGLELEDGGEVEEKERQKKRRMLEEIELIGKRSPRFPGAIDFPKSGVGFDNVVRGDDQALRQALEIKRGVAAEILKVSLRYNRISINYSNNLVSKLPQFVDLVLIEAAAMKGVSEFSHLTFNARAKSYIQSSGIVALVKWLKHNSMSYPQIGKLICMCPDNLTLVKETVERLKSIYVKGEYLGYVLVKAGPIWERGMENLNEIIKYLVKNGVRRDWMGYVISRCPKLLTLSMEELEQRVMFYMEMGVKDNDFGTMVYDYPKALGFFSLDDMNTKVNYLKEFGLNTCDVGRLLAYKPQLMGCSIEQRWKPLVKYLYYLGVCHDGMKRMLMVKPMIFCVDLETTIAPKVRFLQDLGIQEETLGNVLVKFPALLTYSLYKKIRPVVIFLMTNAGVTEKNIGKVIALEPGLVGCSIVHKLDVNVKYFLSLGIRIRLLGEMIADFPMLLKYNLEILRPKYRYLRRVMVRPLRDAIEFPRYFSYSLEGRIIPRHATLVNNRINFKLRYMLGCSDKAFNERVKIEIEKRQNFESGYVNGNSFLSKEENSPLTKDDNQVVVIEEQ